MYVIQAIRLNRQEVCKFFDPSIEAIIKVIGDQRHSVKPCKIKVRTTGAPFSHVLISLSRIDVLPSGRLRSERLFV
jgi:hypothetical protein